MIGLALAYLRDRALPTALNVLLLALAVASLVVLLLLSQRVEDRFATDAAGIDLVVGAKGSPLQLILSSVYHLDSPTGNIPLETVELLRRDPGVGRAIPLALGDNFRGYRIVGTEPEFLSLSGAALADGGMFGQPMDVVVGSEMARRTGATIGQRFAGTHGLGDDDGDNAHDHAPFTVVGILRPTGTVVDRLILTTVPSVWQVHGIAAPAGHSEKHDHDHDHDHHGAHDHDHDHPKAPEPVLDQRGGPQPEITALLISYKSPAAAIRLPASINRQTQLQAASPAAETARFLTLFDGAIAGARLFAGLIAATGALSIFTVLLAAARAREGDLALLRVMGARPSMVFGTVLLEGVLIALMGAILGFAAGHLLVEWAARHYATLGGIGLTGAAMHPAEPWLLLATLLLGALAALIPAARIFRQDLATTLARGQ